VVPLVFKTSLGVVRSPEGSTPSLLRHSRLKNLAGRTETMDAKLIVWIAVLFLIGFPPLSQAHVATDNDALTAWHWRWDVICVLSLRTRSVFRRAGNSRSSDQHDPQIHHIGECRAGD
jgi:hypothetical protein